MSAEQAGIELNHPSWGAHITTARFTQSKTPAELSDFFKLMESAPIIGKSKPSVIEVSFFKVGDGLEYQCHERFSLKP